MTSLDPGAVRILTPAVYDHAVLTDALHHALRRDLGRLERVLVDPVTAVRRGALIEHTCFLLDQVQEHHRVLDDLFWPSVTASRPELADVADRVALNHRELTEPLRRTMNSALGWRRDPRKRLDVLSAVRELAPVLQPVLHQDAELAPMIDEVVGTEVVGTGVVGAVPVAHRLALRAWPGAPTRLARRTFWLLDELDSAQADLLIERTPRTMMWILRNGFSGAYNRSTYLMWVGGGTGPAI